MLKHQVTKNLFTNLLLFLLNVFINLFMTPFYIKYLGLDGLGLIRLALLIPIYVNLITLVVSGAVTRYLTIDLQNNRHLDANITFNSSFFGILILIISTLPFLIYFSFNIGVLINIPERYSNETISLFQNIFLFSAITIFNTLFLIPAYANNRLDLQNYIKIIALILQNFIIIIIFIVFEPDITQIGYAYIFSAIITLILSILIWKKFISKVSINIKYFKYEKLKELMKMGSWLFINQAGSILFLSVDLLIINHYYGAILTGVYSALLQWSILLRTFATMISSVLGPIIMINYAKEQFNKIIEYSKFSVKLMSIIMSIPIGLIIAYNEQILTLWLGNGFVQYAPILNIILIHLTINLAVLPLFYLNTAYNKVKIPGIVSIIFGIFNIILAIVLAVNFNLELFGIALASAIILTLKNAIFTPIYAAQILNINKMVFIKEIFYGISIIVLIKVLSLLLNILININGWVELMLSLTILSVVGLSFSWFILMKNEEKLIIKEIIIKKVKK